LTLGIRAEDFEITDGAEAWMTGEVELIEDLGSDRFVHLKCDRVELVARVGREINLRSRDTIGLNVAPERLHFFQDGRRIEP
jgi:ABC-type sugar transport system ATPase subunit